MPTSEPAIYQLKVVLQGISPMIWRRLLIRGDTTIADLHYILQITMGWSDDHLHQFRIHDKRYGIARIGGILFSDDPDAIRLKGQSLTQLCQRNVMGCPKPNNTREVSSRYTRLLRIINVANRTFMDGHELSFLYEC